MHPFSHLMINIIDTLHIQKEQITGYHIKHRHCTPSYFPRYNILQQEIELHSCYFMGIIMETGMNI